MAGAAQRKRQSVGEAVAAGPILDAHVHDILRELAIEQLIPQRSKAAVAVPAAAHTSTFNCPSQDPLSQVAPKAIHRLGPVLSWPVSPKTTSPYADLTAPHTLNHPPNGMVKALAAARPFQIQKLSLRCGGRDLTTPNKTAQDVSPSHMAGWIRAINGPGHR
ncbi:uncharacterized protein TRIVIDRAFT_65662 [Trichoderma virens Gv29-8]|uniref:Uncharacterized protein n=1 Tax=Hypocrea virens (strain Gv29-8 / FGSC 10586) TaxID=413071 RepID=G9N9F8_HYPVG|nr:uncharacterized protein TRIVIDRAFT_65662 [Trichoderma virens Gv29-8]EHK16578.1 hypothetical protein TRIVIDRAFT_65662 [Trichoderma virens Gv29-8]UKZ52046.1 hypothetical protein TrVGV298_005813 [Trichoderma virens]